ncbi:MAG: hypothetical protein COS94_10600 [Candidatus Hydrogenedentes bacterium CG07_land_8_20_14_0_80_42_17]|nr:MAG: hypothetical protein AUJ18_00815 [Candidatus Hydrogenedentes bacterium CG1_02_42_14]PIU46295.1 MAG: hypothetical protein COS94_10600 [Candidatus Hydrogenedentes bacterium CG07_land_8_20_14_0_80_42_17]
MTEPINFQVNIMQGQDIARLTQQQKDVDTHQVISNEMNRAKESEEEPNQISKTDQSETAQLNKDGSGRGRAFLRQHGEKKEEEKETEENPVEPEKGLKVDTLR